MRLPSAPKVWEGDPAPAPRVILGSPSRPAPSGPTRAIPKVTPPKVGSAPVPRSSDPAPFRRFLGGR